MKRWLSTFVLVVVASSPTAISAAANRTAERHVVLVVWDGMRPDFVTEEQTPVLTRLAREGVIFRNHHAVYVSATNVNGTALATGLYPARTGLIANHEFRSGIDGKAAVEVENPSVVRKGDEISQGKYIGGPTIAELVRKSGGRAVIAASKTVGLLHDRHASPLLDNRSVTLSAGSTLPNDCLKSLVDVLGPFPKPHLEQDEWTTKALTDVLWKNGVPPFSVLWLGEPDLSQHETAPGSEAAMRAIRSADNHLSLVLDSLERYGVRGTTDVLVVSDHGFSTIQRAVNLPKILTDAGFKVRTELPDHPAGDEIMMVGGGGSVLFYFLRPEMEPKRRLVEYLQQSDFAGVLFSRDKFSGTFPLKSAEVNSADAPDIIMSFSWSDGKNQFGVAGMINADWQRGAGKGTHATLSRFDMHNTLVAAGPDFRRAMTDDLPTGNVDVAPTILRILGIDNPVAMDGRVLTEALMNGDAPAQPDRRTIEAAQSFAKGNWHQSLQISRVGTTTYLDEGVGGFVNSSR